MKTNTLTPLAKKLLVLLFAAFFAFSSLMMYQPSGIQASLEQELQNDINSIDEQIKDNEAYLEQLRAQVSTLERKLDELRVEIANLEKQIEKTELQIQLLEEEIAKTEL